MKSHMVSLQLEKIQSLSVLLAKEENIYVGVELKLLNPLVDSECKRIWQCSLHIQDEMSAINKSLVKTILHGMNTLRKLLFVEVMYVVERKNPNRELYKYIT